MVTWNYTIEARNLPNMDLTSERLRRCFTACDACVKPPTTSSSTSAAPEQEEHHGGGNDRDAKVDHRHPKIITSDPYVTVSVPQTTLARTRVMHNSQNPKWNEHYTLPISHPLEYLEFRVKDDDVFGAQTIGTLKIPVSEIASGKLISGWFQLIGQNGKPPKPDTAFLLEMKFTPTEKNPIYKHGIAGDPEQKGVTGTYFPLRKGHSVTLDQDAHITENHRVFK